MIKKHIKKAKIHSKNIFQLIPMPGNIYWKDSNGAYLGCNQIQADMAGVKSPKEIIGKTDYDMPWKNIADILTATDKRIMETGISEELVETATMTDGTKVVMLTNKAPLYDEKGQVIGIIGTSLDITTHSEAEKREKEALSQALEIHKIYLDNILKNVPAAIYWKDIDGYYLGCNDLEAKLADLTSSQDIIGKTDYDLPWHDAADVLKLTDQRIVKTQKTEELIESTQMPDGKKLTVLTSKRPLYNAEEEIIGIIGISFDITERVEAEKREKQAVIAAAEAEAKRRVEEQVKRAVMVLAGSISHDLRTPIANINMINHVLKNLPQEVAKSKDENLLETQIGQLSARIDRMVTRMHQFIDENLTSLKYCTLEALTKETLVTCKSYKEISNALTSYPFKDEEQKLVVVDKSHYFDFLGNPVLFLRILFNLLSNALYQIHQNGRGQIFISCAEEDDANLLRFKDTAGGASPEVVQRIFEGYVTTKEEGTGIGLAFCKLTMESFGGEMTCESVEGDFIEFTLRFPKIPAPTA